MTTSKTTSIVPLVALCIVALFAANLKAQIKHNQVRGDMPPGVSADMSRMGNPELDYHIQPVQVIAPDGSQIEVGVDEGYVSFNSSRVSLGMFVGPVYRLKVTNINQHWGKSLYPSLELLDKLNPPKDLENDFPIQVVITQDDLEQAFKGNLVTKVIYLEDPHNALPQKHLVDKQPQVDVGRREDPMSVARTLGKPMAILRIGSRIPMANDRADFNFRSPEPQFLPDPQGNAVNPKWQEPLDFPPLRLPNENGSRPSIVPGEMIPGLDSGYNVPKMIMPNEAIHRRSSRIPAPNRSVLQR